MEHKTVNQYENGSVNQYEIGNGKFFEAFVPDNCTPVTPVITFQHGLGSDYVDWQSYTQKFSTGNCNSIVIRGQWDRPDDLLYNSIVDEYDIDTSNNLNINVSFSGGSEFSLRETAKMIEENPSNIPPVSFVLDGYVPTDKLKQEGVVDTLVNSDAVVLGFSRQYGPADAYHDLAKEGVNVILLRDTSSFGGAHYTMNKSYMEGGLYEYSLGMSKLPDRYEITVYDSASDSFVPLDYSQVSTLDNVYKYFGLDSPFSENTQQPKLTNLSSSVSDFASEQPLTLKHSNYGGNELSIKPESVGYVMNYLQNTLAADLDDQISALKALNEEMEAYAAEDPAVSYSPDPDFSSVQSVFSAAETAISESVQNISDVSEAIINYGLGNWTDKVSNLLNSFLGIKNDDDQKKGTDVSQGNGTGGGQGTGTDVGQGNGTVGGQGTDVDQGDDTDGGKDSGSEIDNDRLDSHHNNSDNNDSSPYYEQKPTTDNSVEYANLVYRDTDSKTLNELSPNSLDIDNSYSNAANDVESINDVSSNNLYSSSTTEISEKMVIPNVSGSDSRNKTLPPLSRTLQMDELPDFTPAALSATLAIVSAKSIKNVYNKGKDKDEKAD